MLLRPVLCPLRRSSIASPGPLVFVLRPEVPSLGWKKRKSVGVPGVGMPIAAVARRLGVSPPVVRTGLARGADLLQARDFSTAALMAAEKR